jgi:dihydroorotate dehydrogenase electron transfer subunit
VKLNATIVENVRISDGVYRLKLYAPQISRLATPGAFVNLYLNDKTMLLPRPFGISDADPREGSVTIVYVVVGRGTEMLTGYESGVSLRILGPNGNGFFEKSMPVGVETVLLIGGGSGVPPLLLAARRLHEAKERCNLPAVLGYRSEPWYSEPFTKYCDEVHSISETPGFTETTGNVIDVLNAGIQSYRHRDAIILSCGPLPMLRAVSEWGIERGIPVLISMEERMGCGYGVCVGCSVKTVNGKKKVCVDGPVFKGDEIDWTDL